MTTTILISAYRWPKK